MLLEMRDCCKVRHQMPHQVFAVQDLFPECSKVSRIGLSDTTKLHSIRIGPGTTRTGPLGFEAVIYYAKGIQIGDSLSVRQCQGPRKAPA